MPTEATVLDRSWYHDAGARSESGARRYAFVRQPRRSAPARTRAVRISQTEVLRVVDCYCDRRRGSDARSAPENATDLSHPCSRSYIGPLHQLVART